MYRKSCAPAALFDAPVITDVKEEFKDIEVGGNLARTTAFFFLSLSCLFCLRWAELHCIVLYRTVLCLVGHSPSITKQKNLLKFARMSEKLLIATDNDREGENIGFEIIGVCRKGRCCMV